MTGDRDRWAEWILNHRFGGDVALRERTMTMLVGFRDRVLQGARIVPGDDVLDVGCGDGLLGVGALDLVGVGGTVTFSDISTDLLDECRRGTAALAGADRCRFVHTGLPDLGGIASGSVDVAMTRSVLIYVADKRAAFANLHRVLRPGGRLSIFEPINRFGHPEPDDQLWGVDVSGLEPIAGKLKAALGRHMPDTSPMTDFDERDLLTHATEAGFEELHLEYRADVDRQPIAIDLDTLLRVSPNPLVPPYGEVVRDVLSVDEREALLDRVRAQLASGYQRRKLAVAYLTAVRG